MQVRVINTKNCATRHCVIGDVFDVIHFAKEGEVDHDGNESNYDSAAFINPKGRVSVGWTSGPRADLEIVEV